MFYFLSRMFKTVKVAFFNRNYEKRTGNFDFFSKKIKSDERACLLGQENRSLRSQNLKLRFLKKIPEGPKILRFLVHFWTFRNFL